MQFLGPTEHGIYGDDLMHDVHQTPSTTTMECVVLSKHVSVAKQVLAWAMWKMKMLPHSNYYSSGYMNCAMDA
jgi:hypothetical protein